MAGPAPSARRSFLNSSAAAVVAAGSEFAIQQFAADEEISSIVEEACAHAFYWNNPRATGEFFDFVRARDANRLWTFPLLDTLWQQYSVTTSIDRLEAEPPPTVEDFDKMSDEEIEKTLTEARKLRARNQIR
jgi:hypothetical protein